MAVTPVNEPSEATAAQDALGGKVRVVVVTPERAAFDGLGEFVVLPMFDGELGVLPGRSPLIGRLGAGELRIRSATGTTRFYVEPGFAQVQANVVTVLTARAVKAEAVTAAAAEQAAATADALPGGTAAERAGKDRARERAQGMKKVAAKNAAAV